MIDKIELKIYVLQKYIDELELGGYHVPYEFFPAGYSHPADVVRDSDNVLHIENERTRWESLKSSHSGMAFYFEYKVIPPPHRDACEFPHVKIKCSPQKLLQGHNAYGLVTFRDGVKAMLGLMHQHYPNFIKILDYNSIKVAAIDVNKTALFNDVRQKVFAAEMISKISVGQRKIHKAHVNGCQWNTGDSKGVLYDKGLELNEGDQRECKRIIEAEGNLPFVQRMLRFEYKVRHPYLEKRGISTKLSDWLILSDDEIDKKLHNLWLEYFSPILTAVKGASMKVLDDDWILEKLKETYVYYHWKTNNPIYSKAERLFGFYKTLCNSGYDSVDWSISKNKRARAALIEAGIPAVHLMNMKAGKAVTKVIYLKDMVKMQFSDPVPSNYVYPSVASL